MPMEVKEVMPMEVMELVKSSKSESDVEMTPFVNLGNEEEMMMVVTKEMMMAMKETDKAESQKLTKKKTKKKMSKKEKLVEMAMARLKEMEMAEKDYNKDDVGMLEVMRLVALEPQIIGPVVEVGRIHLHHSITIIVFAVVFLCYRDD